MEVGALGAATRWDALRGLGVVLGVCVRLADRAVTTVLKVVEHLLRWGGGKGEVVAGRGRGLMMVEHLWDVGGSGSKKAVAGRRVLTDVQHRQWNPATPTFITLFPCLRCHPVA